MVASFLGTGGATPYAYSVVAGGAGGSIDSTGVYTAPGTAPSDPSRVYDTIRVTDSAAASAASQILVGTPLLLLCEILQRGLGLDSTHIYLWDQKIPQPKDSGLYVAVSVPLCKPFGSSVRMVDGIEQRSVNVRATVDVDIISRGPSARDRKEEVLLVLNSFYSQRQQDANSFYIGKLSTNFVNLSEVDGDAIPYRYKISIALMYAVTNASSSEYFDTFTVPPSEIVVDDGTTPPCSPSLSGITCEWDCESVYAGRDDCIEQCQIWQIENGC